jgi:hypothetical protein
VSGRSLRQTWRRRRLDIFYEIKRRFYARTLSVAVWDIPLEMPMLYGGSVLETESIPPRRIAEDWRGGGGSRTSIPCPSIDSAGDEMASFEPACLNYSLRLTCTYLPSVWFYQVLSPCIAVKAAMPAGNCEQRWRTRNARVESTPETRYSGTGI